MALMQLNPKNVNSQMAHLPTVNLKPLVGSTCVRGPAAGKSFSSLCVVLLTSCRLAQRAPYEYSIFVYLVALNNGSNCKTAT